MKLKKLLQGLNVRFAGGASDIEITGISNHSSIAAPGHLFLSKAKKDSLQDQYITQAVKAGVSAVITDIYNPFLPVAQVITPNVGAIESEIIARYFGNPSKELFLVCVTGTNGKTTTTYYTQHLLSQQGIKRCGRIGTIEYDIGRQTLPAHLTTPDLLLSSKLMSEMKKNGLTSCAMEASSHALDQGRLESLSIDVAIFTNLTQDHLDYHKTMEQYAAAKKKLFHLVNRDGVVILNKDDKASLYMAEGVTAKIVWYSNKEKADIMATDVEYTQEGTEFVLHIGDSKKHIQVPCIGEYNISNLLAAIGAAVAKGIAPEEIFDMCKTLPKVPGRLEKIESQTGQTVIIDYAHTPDALEKALKALKVLPHKKLICVFGCGGERDRLKRPQMGAIAERYADYTIITSDNPRSEDPKMICQEVASGFTTNTQPTLEIDRREAIRKALSLSSEGDIILIAGRGHEMFQHFASGSVSFLDAEVVRQLMQEKQQVGR